jgi:hypothetical protein
MGRTLHRDESNLGGAYQLQDKKMGKDKSNPWNAEQLRWFYA